MPQAHYPSASFDRKTVSFFLSVTIDRGDEECTRKNRIG